MRRLPMVEDFVVPIGGAEPNPRARDEVVRAWNIRAKKIRDAAVPPTVPDSAKTVFGLGLFAGLVMTIGGAYLGYRLLQGRFPLSGYVGAMAGFYVVPKVAGPLVGALLKPQADQAAADMKKAGLMGCGPCGG